MPLPIIIAFTRDWDPKPIQFFTSYLEQFAKWGYDTLCFEYAEKYQAKILTIINRRIEEDESLKQDSIACLRKKAVLPAQDLSELPFDKLESLFKLYVSSKGYREVAIKVKSLPAAKAMQVLFTKVQRSTGWITCGVDIDKGRPSFSSSSHDNYEAFGLTLDLRSKHFVNRLSELQLTKKGLILLSGAAHSVEVIRLLKERNMNAICFSLLTSVPFCAELKETDYVTTSKENPLVMIDTRRQELDCLDKLFLQLMRGRETGYEYYTYRDRARISGVNRFWRAKVSEDMQKALNSYNEQKSERKMETR